MGGKRQFRREGRLGGAGTGRDRDLAMLDIPLDDGDNDKVG